MKAISGALLRPSSVKHSSTSLPEHSDLTLLQCKIFQIHTQYIEYITIWYNIQLNKYACRVCRFDFRLAFQCEALKSTVHPGWVENSVQICQRIDIGCLSGLTRLWSSDPPKSLHGLSAVQGALFFGIEQRTGGWFPMSSGGHKST